MLGGQLVGSKMQAGAAKGAAKTQAAAAEQARLLQQQMYQQTRADLSPYMQQGSQGLSALSSLLGVGGIAPTSGLKPVPPPTAPAPGAGGMVMLRAPTGQTQAVPAEQAEFFLSRGATRV